MKKFFAKIHLWLSIPFGIIIAIVCLTGAILVFETEILEFCYPSRYFVKEIKSEPLSPATLMDTARGQLPDSIKINGIRVSSDPKRTYQLILPGKKALHRRNYRHRRWKRVLHEDNAPSPLAVGRI